MPPWFGVGVDRGKKQVACDLSILSCHRLVVPSSGAAPETHDNEDGCWLPLIDTVILLLPASTSEAYGASHQPICDCTVVGGGPDPLQSDGEKRGALP